MNIFEKIKKDFLNVFRDLDTPESYLDEQI